MKMASKAKGRPTQILSKDFVGLLIPFREISMFHSVRFRVSIRSNSDFSFGEILKMNLCPPFNV